MVATSSDVPTKYSPEARTSPSEPSVCFPFLLDLDLAFDLAMTEVAAGQLFGSK